MSEKIYGGCLPSLPSLFSFPSLALLWAPLLSYDPDPWTFGDLDLYKLDASKTPWILSSSSLQMIYSDKLWQNMEDKWTWISFTGHSYVMDQLLAKHDLSVSYGLMVEDG